MTAEDVAFHLRRRAQSCRRRRAAMHQADRFWARSKKVEPTGPYAVRLTTKQPDPLIERRLAGWGAQIVSKARVPRRQGLGRMGSSTRRHRPLQSKRIQRAANRSCSWRTISIGGGPPPAASVKFQIVPEIAARMGGLVSRRLRPDHRGTPPTSSTPLTATRISRSSAARS